MLAYNEATGETGEYLVTATIAHHDPTVVYLTISGETLTTTAEHPFYTTDGEWIDAGELTLGAEIVALDGTFGTVEAVTVAADAQPMYNLTVDTAHTFFVGDGQWLVHNTDGCEIFYRSMSSEEYEAVLKHGGLVRRMGGNKSQLFITRDTSYAKRPYTVFRENEESYIRTLAFHVELGTEEMLLDHGGAFNSPARLAYPDLRPWSRGQDLVQVKGENDAITYGLGYSVEALQKFNNAILRDENGILRIIPIR